MKIIHIVGRQKNGKTTLIIDLIAEMKKRGIRVGTLKHSSHSYELDKPGKDSFLHRKAGSIPAAIATKDLMAIFLPREPHENPFEKMAPLFNHTDLVLVEGYASGPGKKVEVWRKEAGTTPLLFEQNSIEAVITDDQIKTDRPVWPRKDIVRLADHILELAGF
jgi:molybdopterin-guanine dinucleotide biosynthesis protein B